MTKVHHDIPLRSARNSILQLFYRATDDPSAGNQLYAYPLQDLPVCYREKITHGDPAVVFLIGAEEGVEYLLHDDQGEPLAHQAAVQGQLIRLGELTPEAAEETIQQLEGLKLFPAPLDDASLAFRTGPAGPPAELFLRTWKRALRFIIPAVTEDITYTILARKNIIKLGKPVQLEVFLSNRIFLRSGIDTGLLVEFVPAETDALHGDGSEISIDYHKTVRVKVTKSQEGVRYQLIEYKTKTSWTPRSAIVVGGTQGASMDIELVSNSPDAFQEDAVLVVRAFRQDGKIDSTDPLLAADLDKKLKVWVRPNPNLDVTFLPGKENPQPYRARPEIRINQPQASTDYQLFRYPLPPAYSYEAKGAAYSPDGIVTGAAKQQALSGAALLTGYMFENGQPAAGDFPIDEDSLLLVRATKKVNGETLWLTKHLVVLVRPDPGPRVSADPPFFTEGEQVRFRLVGAQRRVGYQLQKVPGGEPIGPTLLTGADRGTGWPAHGRVFGMPIKLADPRPGDLKVSKAGETRAELFPGDVVAFVPLFPQENTLYRVEAIKEYTGLTGLLSQQVTARRGYLQFNGVSDRITAAGYKGIAAGQARTFEGWIRPLAAGPILAWGAGTKGARWSLRINENGFLHLDIQGTNMTGSTNLLDGAWRHIACVLESPASGAATLGHVRFYVDGVLELSTAADTKINTGQDQDLTIGNDQDKTFYRGDMAEIRLWEKALPAADLQKNLFVRLEGKEPGLSVYWKLDEGKGNTANDGSGNNRHGTLEGGTWK